MATIIDALLVTLSLDTSGVKRGRQEAESAQKKLRADAERTQKEFDEKARQIGVALSQVRNQVIGLLAAFTAGRGLREFVDDLTRSDAALGRTAKNIGVSADELSAWQGVAERAGGTAAGITGSMESLARNFQELALTGQSAVVPYFRALHVALADSQGKMRPVRDILFDLADHLSKLDPAKAQAIGAGLGFDQGTINVLMQGRAALADLLAEQEKLGHANAEDTAAAQRRQAAFNGLGQASQDLGRKLLTALTPAILAVTKALTKLSEWAARHRTLVQAFFFGLSAAVVAFAVALAAPLAGLAALSAAIVSAIAAIALLYDDWKTWISGGKAAFSGFWQFFADKWATAKDIVEPIFESWNTYILGFVQTWKDAFTLIWQVLSGNSDQIRDAWSHLVDDLKADLTNFVDLVKHIGPVILEAFKSAFSSAFDWAEGRFKAVRDAITGHRERTSAAAAPKMAPTGGTDIEKFVAMGWTPAQAAGIVANIQRESGGNEKAVGDDGEAYGLGQWHRARQQAFASWAGHDIRQSTREEQLAFINYELRQGQEKKAGDLLETIKDAAIAGAAISRYYERPKDTNGEAQARALMADDLLNKALADPTLRLGAANSVVNSQTTSATSTSQSVNIDTLNVNGANVRDAQSFADTLRPVLQFSFAGQANTGLTG
jgi:hypothetical protein